MDRPVRIVLVGAGSRGHNYTSYALREPERMQVTAVVDPNALRRKAAAERFSIPEENLFDTVEAFVESGVTCDAAINATMDELHVPLSLKLMEAGLDILVEKPVSLDEASLLDLYDAAVRLNRRIMVCHVLRYTPFYSAVKHEILEGALGEIKAINTEENVSFHHVSAAFLRGKWGNFEKCGSRILMAKCCHDLDMLTWLKSGTPARYVGSLGTRFQFKPEHAPKGAGTRCLVDCSCEGTCPYSARKLYVRDDMWDYYAWCEQEDALGHALNEAEREAFLKGDHPFGRCVYRNDSDTEDVQSVVIQFEDGSIATHGLYTGTPKPCRTLHIVGTKGELYGVFEEGWYVVRTPHQIKGCSKEYDERRVEINESLEGHGGGDKRIIEDFIHMMRAEPVSVSFTGLDGRCMEALKPLR